jgi:hypothetical protein
MKGTRYDDIAGNVEAPRQNARSRVAIREKSKGDAWRERTVKIG